MRSLFDYRGPLHDAKYADSFKAYTYFQTSEHSAEHRAALEVLWQRFQALGLADPDFLERFPFEVGPRIWEMRVACTFSGWGWRLRPSPRRGQGPDFGVLLSDGRVAWVEATAPGDAQGPEAVGAVLGRRVIVGGDVDRKIKLRYLSSIHEKRAKWKHWVETKLVSASDGFVIAISGSVVPEGHFEMDELPRIAKIAYGLGDPTFIVNPQKRCALVPAK